MLQLLTVAIECVCGAVLIVYRLCIVGLYHCNYLHKYYVISVFVVLRNKKKKLCGLYYLTDAQEKRLSR